MTKRTLWATTLATAILLGGTVAVNAISWSIEGVQCVNHGTSGTSIPKVQPCPRFLSWKHTRSANHSQNRFMAGLRDQVVQQQETIQTLQTNMEDAKANILTLEQSLAEQARQIANLQQLLSQTQLTVTSHRSDFTAHRHTTEGVESGLPYYP